MLLTGTFTATTFHELRQKASYNGPGETSPHIYILFLEDPLTNLKL